mgnify:CR=1 FL=1
MIAHTFQRFANFGERLAPQLRVFYFVCVNLARVTDPRQFAKFERGAIFLRFDLAGDNVKAVDDAPSQTLGNGLHPGFVHQ